MDNFGYTKAADVWGPGVLLFQMAKKEGAYPFTKESTAEQIGQ